MLQKIIEPVSYTHLDVYKRQVYKLPKDRLYVSVFEGDPSEGIPPSTIALEEWKKLVAVDHIIYGNKKDNFWEMGDTGP